MPDPGEPHHPEREHYDTEEEYWRAVDDYTNMILPPELIAARLKAVEGQAEIEAYLEEHRD